MKKLPIYARTLLLHGASTMGTFTEGFFYVEESIQVNHSLELHDFCKWIDENIGGASINNIDMLFKAFKYPHNLEATTKAKELAEKINAIKFAH